MQHLSFRAALAAAVAASLAPPLYAADLAAVVVTATRQATRANELLSDVTVIERDEIERAGQTTLAEFLARQPGLEYTANGSPGATSGVAIRGASADQTLVLVDGQRVSSATSGKVAFSRLPLAQIERIEILRGPASGLYGADAIGGVVQIFTRRGDGPAQGFVEIGSGRYGAQSGSAGVLGGEDGWRYSLSATSARTDGFNSIDNPRNKAYNIDRDGFKNDSLATSLSYAPAPGHEAGINLFDSTGRHKYDGGTTTTTAARQYDNATSLQNVGLHLKNALTQDWSSTLRFGRATDDQTNYTNNAMTSIFRTHQNQLSWQHDLRLSAGNLMFAGEALRQSVAGTTAFPVNERLIRSWLTGWNAHRDAHRVQASLRRDDNSQFGARNTGALAYGYQIDAAWRAHASYGTAFRAPTFNDLYSPLSFGLQGNPDLRPEFARNREFALHHERGTHQFSATYYRNRINDLISWAGRTTPANVGMAKIDGITLAYSGRLATYDVAASFDHQDPRDADTGRVLAKRAKQRLNFSAGRSLGSWEWRGEMQAVGARYDDDANTTRMGGYTLFHVHAAYQLGRDCSVFARVNNLFGKKYQTVADYATPAGDYFVGLRYTLK